MLHRFSAVLITIIITCFTPQTALSLEYGNLTNVTHAFQTVRLSQSFSDPVVIAGPASFNEPDAGVIIVDNVTGSSFDIRFREWNYLDGVHSPESVSFMVVERGIVEPTPGIVIQSGTINIGHRWTKQLFPSSFNSLPILQTTVASSQSANTVSTRLRRFSSSGFEAKVWQEEQLNNRNVTESLNWVAVFVDPSVSEPDWEMLQVRADERFTVAPFNDQHLLACVFADVTSPTANPYTVRKRNNAVTGLEVIVHEEQSRDIELRLPLERVSMLSIECDPSRFEDTIPPDWANTELVVDAKTQTSLSLAWNPGATDESDPVTYTVLVNDVELISIEQHTYSVSGLTEGTEYDITIRASDTEGNSSEIHGVFATTPAPDLDPPDWGGTPAMVTDVTQNSARVSWSPGAADASLPIDYAVYVDEALITTTRDLAYTLSGLTPETDYLVRVIATDAQNNPSSISNRFLTEPAPENIGPDWGDVVLSVNAITDTSASLSWSPGANDESLPINYTVRLGEDIIFSTQLLSYELTDLSAETPYEVSVTAIDAIGNTSILNTSFTTDTPPDTDGPDWANTELLIENITANSARMSWGTGASDDSPPVRYEVLLNDIEIDATDQVAFNLSNLSAATNYIVTIRAIDSLDNASELTGEFVTNEPPDTTPPNWSDTALTVNAVSTNSADLSWVPGAVDESPTLSYEVLLNGVAVGSTEQQTYQLTELSSETEYPIVIRAIDEAGNTSDVSATFITHSTPPTPEYNVETGLITSLTDENTTISFAHSFVDPIVVAGPASSTDLEPGVVVVENITSTSFDIRFKEWDYLDGIHHAESVYYLAVERGTTHTPSGLTIEANTTQVGSAWSPVTFETSFSAKPMVLTTISSSLHDQTVAPRIKNIDNLNFLTRLWNQEANNSNPESELLNWIAISKGNNSNETGLVWETRTVEADENISEVYFSNTYTSACVVADINSLTPNPSTLRQHAKSIDSIEIFIQEESSKDAEYYLGLETVDLFISECTQLDKDAPIWNDIFATSNQIDLFSVELSFGSAVDMSGTVYYRVYQNGIEVGTTSETNYLVTELEPSTEYIFSVEAIDQHGNATNDGPSVTHVTQDAPSGSISGLLWLDSNLNGELDESDTAMPVSQVLLYRDNGDMAGEIDLNDELLRQTNSSNDGQFSFEFLASDRYVLSITPVPGFQTLSEQTIIDLELIDEETISGINFGFRKLTIDSNLITNGYDWSFSPTAQRSNNSGVTWLVYDDSSTDPLKLANRHASDVFGVDTADYQAPRFAVFAHVTWKTVNPEEGVFDWSSIDSIINDVWLNGMPGVGYFIWPRVYGDNIPQWVNDKYQANFDSDYTQIFSQRDPDTDAYLFNNELSAFINELVSRYAHDPKLVYIDMRTAFDTRTGEWSVREGYEEVDGQHIQDWTRTYHQLWEEAFMLYDADMGKLVSVIAWPHFGGSELLQENYTSGKGQRDGQPSRWQIWGEAYGNSVNEEGYIVIDELSPSVISQAVKYSEATEFSFTSATFGTVSSTMDRLRAALLWTLHVRRNWVAVPQRVLFEKTEHPYTSLNQELQVDYEEAQDMVRWVQLQLGHNAASANEAWSWPKQTIYTIFNNNAPDGTETITKNLERWLYQRDVLDNGTTQPYDQILASELFGATRSGISCDEVFCDHYTSRRTDVANNHHYMYFDVDSSFAANNLDSVTVKVTYHDLPDGDWRLEYYDDSSQLRSTLIVPTEASGGIRTATLSLHDFQASGGFQDSMDFRIVAAGDNDVAIALVRFIK